MKKLLIVCCMVMFTSSLFAFDRGEKYIYGGFGLGVSVGWYKPISGAEAGTKTGGSPYLFNDLENRECLAWNIGAGGEYFLLENLALLGGIYYESLPIKGVYPKKTASSDLEITTDFKYLSIPAGFHYYFLKYFLIGGGLYYSKVLSDDTTVKCGSYEETGRLKSKDDVGAFLDLGTALKITETGNLIIFARAKTGRTVSDKDDYRTDVQVSSLTFNAAYGISF